MVYHSQLSKVKSIFLDVAIGVYCVIILHRIIYVTVIPIEVQTLPEISTLLALQYFGIGAFLGIFVNSIGCSVGTRVWGEIQAQSWKETIFFHISWIIFVLTIITGWQITKISPVDFFSSKGITAAGNIFSALFHPETAILYDCLVAIVETIYIALVSTLLALPFAFVLSFAAARNLMNATPTLRFSYNLARIFTNFTRSIEPLIWAIVFSVWVGIGPFAGMLALSVATVSSLIKLYSEQIESIDPGPIEAIEATGAKPLQVIWFAVVPQIILPFLSYTIYRWDINVRMATVIGLVGGGGIGTLLMQYQGLAKWNEVGMIVFLIALVVWAMDFISSRVREAMK